jgi:hypothetical protein
MIRSLSKVTFLNQHHGMHQQETLLVVMYCVVVLNILDGVERNDEKENDSRIISWYHGVG